MTRDTMTLDGKRALVCGGSRGIGLATGLELARRGARVTLVARDPVVLEASVAGLPGDGHDFLAVDFTKTEEVVAAVDARMASDGTYQILINNTGGPPGGPIVDAAPDAFEQALRMHVIVSQRLVQTLLPGMRDAGYGRILNIISTSVREPIPGLGVSNTTRGAMAGWAKTLSRELGPDGITVNNVLPGFTDTERLASLIEKRSEREGKSPADVANAMRSLIPLGRFAEAGEVAAAIGFLASPAASYITGVSLPVDGGRLNSI